MTLICNTRKQFIINNSRLRFSAGYYSAPIFYNSKNLNCIGALSFLRLKEEYWRSPFLTNFIGVNLKREMKLVKKFGVIFFAEQNESGAKRE